jgi:hypothetical protein
MKQVEFHSKNKFEKLVHLVGLIIRIYQDARSSECQIKFTAHLCPVLGLRMSAAIPLFPYMPSLHRQGNFTFTDKSKLHACKDYEQIRFRE